jgi:hypothetical protein
MKGSKTMADSKRYREVNTPYNHYWIQRDYPYKRYIVCMETTKESFVILYTGTFAECGNYLEEIKKQEILKEV